MSSSAQRASQLAGTGPEQIPPRASTGRGINECEMRRNPIYGVLKRRESVLCRELASFSMLLFHGGKKRPL